MYSLPMPSRRTLLKSLSLAPVALLAPKVALGMGVGPRLVERPWDALVGLDLKEVHLKGLGAVIESTQGSFLVGAPEDYPRPPFNKTWRLTIEGSTVVTEVKHGRDYVEISFNRLARIGSGPIQISWFRLTPLSAPPAFYEIC